MFFLKSRLHFISSLAGGCLLWGYGLLRAEPPVQEQVMRVYQDRAKGEDFEKTNDFLEALVRYQDALLYLKDMHDRYPEWNKELVGKSLEEFQKDIDRLQPSATRQVLGSGSALGGSPFLRPALRFQQAQTLEKEKRYREALLEYESVLTTLAIWHTADPKWETVPMEAKMKECRESIARLEKVLIQQDIDFRSKQIPVQ